MTQVLEFRNLIFTKHQFAKLVGKSIKAIDSEIKRGKIKSYKLGTHRNSSVYINGVSLALDLLKAYCKDNPNEEIILSFTGLPDSEVASLKKELELAHISTGGVAK